MTRRSRPRVGASPSSPSRDRKSTRLNSSHRVISYAVFCLKKKNCGPIGSLAILASRVAGAARIYVVEPNPKRAAIALQLGAVANLEGERAQQVTQIRDLTNGMGVDIFFF